MVLHDVTPWPTEAIWQAVAPGLPGFTVEVVPEIDSTNAELMRRARLGRHGPVLLVAEHQTAGRGRLGRAWIDQPGAVHTGPGTLMFSLGLPLSPRDWSGLSLAIGLSLAESLHPDIALKWPNDLWWRDRKLAGILVETVNWGGDAAQSSRFAVIGVGLNITCPTVSNLSTAPAGLSELLSGVDARQALVCMVAPLVHALHRFEQHGFGPLRAAFNARDALANAPVTLSDGTHGVAQGVDTAGALMVQTAVGMQRMTSSEVSVRPLAAPVAHPD